MCCCSLFSRVLHLTVSSLLSNKAVVASAAGAEMTTGLFHDASLCVTRVVSVKALTCSASRKASRLERRPFCWSPNRFSFQPVSQSENGQSLCECEVGGAVDSLNSPLKHELHSYYSKQQQSSYLWIITKYETCDKLKRTQKSFPVFDENLCQGNDFLICAVLPDTVHRHADPCFLKQNIRM